MESTISYQTALIHVMVIAAFADGKLKDSEVHNIKETVKTLPIFIDYPLENLARVIGDCTAMLDQEEGIDAVVGLVKEALPEKLRETAYALACDIIAVDGDAAQEELVWLKLLRDQLHINQLHSAAIEWGTRARYVRAEDL